MSTVGWDFEYPIDLILERLSKLYLGNTLKTNHMSLEEIISQFNQASEKIKKLETDMKNTNIELNRVIKESSKLFPLPTKYVDILSELQKKIHELEIQRDDEREHRNQIALKISRLKKQSLS